MTLPLALLAAGCSADDDPNGGTGDSGTDTIGGGDGDGGGLGDGDGDGGLGLDVPSEEPVEDGRETECTTNEAGERVCVCVSLATWGALGEWGAKPGADGQDAIGSWLNENSTGEAQYFAAKPTITAEALEEFDVIILQNLNGWTFTAEEVAAVEAWVRGGGGVISLSGYSDMPSEAAPTNQLLAFTGMAYSGLSGAGNISSGPSQECAYCLGNSDAQGGWTDHAIAKNVEAVGALWGRSVDPGANGQIVAEWDGEVAGAAAEVDDGRVFMFHDEWVTYNSQWNGETLDQDCRELDPMYNSCGGVHPTVTYQIPQFWFNSIKWASGDPACFNIEDETIIK